MGDKFEMSTGQAHELAMAFGRSGWTNKEVKALCKGSVLCDVRSVIRGYATIAVSELVIDCDADPCLPSGWTVEEHVKGGQFEWDASRVERWLASGQENDNTLRGEKLRNELRKKPCFNANVLDFLLSNPHLIPEEWKGGVLYFWGTVYRDSYHWRPCIRGLCWNGVEWRGSLNWLHCIWRDDMPAAVRVS